MVPGTITSWNPGAEQVYGYAAREVIGQPISLLLPSNLADDLPWIVDALARGERVDHFETVHLRRDGRPIHVSVTTSAVRDTQGKLIGISTVTRDVTQRKWTDGLLAGERRVFEMIARGLPLADVLDVLARTVEDLAGDGLLVSILVTGLIAVMLNPLRLRLQHGINRLMYGDRDDPITVISDLGKKLERSAAPGETLSTLVETVGRMAFPEERRPTRWAFGLLGALATVAILGTLVYYAHKLDAAGLSWLLVASPWAVFAFTPFAKLKRDPDAAIFRYAKYGIVGDCREILPELTRAVKGG